MIIIVLMLALVDKPTMTWTQLNILLMLMECDQQPSGERDKATSPGQKLVSQFGNLQQRINQIGHVKGVSKTHAGKSLLMTNSMDWYR